MMFKDRTDAGQQLSVLLSQYRGQPNVVVFGLARGGVAVAYEVAKSLGCPLDVICTRKIGAPSNPEFALGAITESGEGYFDFNTINQLNVSKKYLEETIASEKAVAAHRYAIFTGGRPKNDVTGKIVLLVDDGLATGATMKAAIQSVKKKNVQKIVVAVPVSPKETLTEIESLADHVVCLQTPASFYAVGQFYEDFGQVEEGEVLAFLKKS